MAYIFGDQNEVTNFSYFEYQLLMFCLAGGMCICMIIVEFGMQRFALLPMLFPGMFSIREKRLFFFDIEVRDVSVGKAMRWEAMMITRVTIFVVLSYIWESCVFETNTHVGKAFPQEQCSKGMDCFASELNVVTIFNRNHLPVDCEDREASKGEDFFENKMVISCLGFVRPSAQLWLMHAAICHAVVQLTLKAYGLLVWTCGQSPWFHRLMAICGIASLIAFVVMCSFSVMTQEEFQASWLAFVLSLSLPVFFQIVWKSGKILQHLWLEESRRTQDCIEHNLGLALKDLATTNLHDGNTADNQPEKVDTRKRPSLRTKASSLLKLPGTFWKNRSMSSESAKDGAESKEAVEAIREQQAGRPNAADVEVGDGQNTI
jgi:hypothetical protein